MKVKKRWMVVAGTALVLIGSYVWRTYPRSVNITLDGIQYHLGSTPGVTPVTVALHGFREQPLFGPETFFGTIDIAGATLPYLANGIYQTIPLNAHFGGLIVYYTRLHQLVDYGAIYPNRGFTEFAVQEWQHSGWSSANGLVIAAPAQTRTQGLQLANKLMHAYVLPGHPLK